jgi:hypothetical protein
LTARPWIWGTRRLLADLLRRFAIWIARERSAAGAR